MQSQEDKARGRTTLRHGQAHASRSGPRPPLRRAVAPGNIDDAYIWHQAALPEHRNGEEVGPRAKRRRKLVTSPDLQQSSKGNPGNGARGERSLTTAARRRAALESPWLLFSGPGPYSIDNMMARRAASPVSTGH